MESSKIQVHSAATPTCSIRKLLATLNHDISKASVHLSREEGGSLAEFTLIAPLMLCLLTGIFGLGFALTFYLQLNNAVDVGARTVAVIRASNSDGTTPDPCAAAYTAITNAAPTLNKSQIQLSFNINGTPYNNVTSCTNGAANIVAGKTAQVSATYPYTVMIFGWKPMALNMTAQTTELLQ
ncbi:TadE/TadG family type IV pilus assembly protein [Occallatibacter savannae]|uniref:TadE/TadG family type IV pilus assembly protein n=1 Tax=Occallatibacter savannae TaxID=1002691 RepID=UPI0013A5474B|nr:TadE/TadG family type IV pilus assembly protein [Occallatibacter savannae]